MATAERAVVGLLGRFVMPHGSRLGGGGAVKVFAVSVPWFQLEGPLLHPDNRAPIV